MKALLHIALGGGGASFDDSSPRGSSRSRNKRGYRFHGLVRDSRGQSREYIIVGRVGAEPTRLGMCIGKQVLSKA